MTKLPQLLHMSQAQVVRLQHVRIDDDEQGSLTRAQEAEGLLCTNCAVGQHDVLRSHPNAWWDLEPVRQQRAVEHHARATRVALERDVARDHGRA